MDHAGVRLTIRLNAPSSRPGDRSSRQPPVHDQTQDTPPCGAHSQPLLLPVPPEAPSGINATRPRVPMRIWSSLTPTESNLYYVHLRAQERRSQMSNAQSEPSPPARTGLSRSLPERAQVASRPKSGRPPSTRAGGTLVSISASPPNPRGGRRRGAWQVGVSAVRALDDQRAWSPGIRGALTLEQEARQATVLARPQ